MSSAPGWLNLALRTADMLDDTTKMGRFQGMLRAELNKVNDFACAFRLHVPFFAIRPEGRRRG